MANTDVLNLIIDLTKDYFTYMMPIIALMAGIVFITSWFHSILFGAGRRAFKE